MTIPGPIKNNRFLSHTFDVVVKDFLSNYNVVKEILWDITTGPEAFIIIEKDPGVLKEEAIKYESDKPLGAIFDINVFTVEGDSVDPITRKELGVPEKKCMICDNTKKECVTNQTHSDEEFRQFIDKLINDNIDF